MPNRNNGYVRVRYSEDDVLRNVSMPKNEACNHAMTIEEYKEKFAFTNIKKNAKVETEAYVGIMHNGYYYLQTTQTQSDRTGWKIHISTDNNNLSNAWDIIMPILIKEKVPAFKVALHINEVTPIPNNGYQEGKSIVIYISSFSLGWFDMLVEINNALNKAMIKQGHIPKFRYSINNSDNYEITDIDEPAIIINQEENKRFFYLSNDKMDKDTFKKKIANLTISKEKLKEILDDPQLLSTKKKPIKNCIVS